MFFGRNACQGLEPVGIMGGSVLDRPVLHGLGDHIRVGGGEFSALLHDLADISEDALGHGGPHLAEGKYILAVDLLYIQLFLAIVHSDLFLPVCSLRSLSFFPGPENVPLIGHL